MSTDVACKCYSMELQGKKVACLSVMNIYGIKRLDFVNMINLVVTQLVVPAVEVWIYFLGGGNKTICWRWKKQSDLTVLLEGFLVFSQ